MTETLDNMAGTFDSKKDAVETAGKVRVWLDALELAGDCEKEWREDVKEATDIYCASDDAIDGMGSSFNIYHSNIQTLLPALYNSTPIPDVRRRFADVDPLGRVGSDVLDRTLSYSIDGYDFDDTVISSVFDMLLAGRGLARVTYEAQTVPMTDEMGMPVVDEMGEPIEDVAYQAVGCEHVPWATFRHGPARRWSDVPWVAFAHYYTKEGLRSLAGKKADDVALDMYISSDKEGPEGDRPAKEIFKRALVWEIWDKESRKVIFISPSYTDGPLLEIDDPLGLEKFFPVPRPMMAIQSSGDMSPICEYRVYKDLLIELDAVTYRIRKLVAQLRPRGLYAGNESDVERIADAEDGELVGASDVVGFLEGGGLDKLISWFPLDPAAKTVQMLWQQRESIKQTIYEVTGLSDIIRGQSNAAETLGAQKIKQQWGSLRIQRRQQEVQRFVRDLFRLKAELIAEKFEPATLNAICGYEVDPQVVAMFRDQRVRDYKIDIETDSTIRGDLVSNQEAMSNFVMASAQYFQAMGPVVQSGAVPMDAAATIYGSFARNFRLGREVEETLDKLVDHAKQQQQQQAQNQKPDPEVIKAQKDAEIQQQKMQADAQKTQAELQFKMQVEQAKIGLEAQKHQDNMALEREKMARDEAQRADELKFNRYVRKQEAFGNAMVKNQKPTEIEDDDEAMEGPFDQVMSALNQMAMLIAEMAKQNGQSQVQLAQSVNELKEIVAAPAEIIRDENGKPIGAQKMLQRTIN